MVSLGPIAFQLGLPLDINGNDGENKFKVHNLKNVAKMTNFWSKIGQDTTFAPNFSGHNSAIFHPILTFDQRLIGYLIYL